MPVVVVESPAKAKTINKYLGRGYTVKASMGHVRDLPKKKLGVDVVTVLPTGVLGRLDYRLTPTTKPLIDTLNGKAPVPFPMNLVDVRDVARPSSRSDTTTNRSSGTFASA